MSLTATWSLGAFQITFPADVNLFPFFLVTFFLSLHFAIQNIRTTNNLISRSVCESVSLPMSTCPSTCLSVWLAVCLLVCLTDCLSVCLTICLSVCLTVDLSVCPFTASLDLYVCGLIQIFGSLIQPCIESMGTISEG